MPIRFLWRVIVLVCVVSAMNQFGFNRAFAQLKQTPRQQYSRSLRNRPTVSPYTSLLNGGNTTDNGSLSYYNIVRPQQRAQKAARNLGNELRTVESRVQKLQNTQSATSEVEAISTGRMAPTGHRTTFGDLFGYFPAGPQSR